MLTESLPHRGAITAGSRDNGSSGSDVCVGVIEGGANTPRYALCLLLALIAHALVFATKWQLVRTQPIYPIEHRDTVELSLVEAAPAFHERVAEPPVPVQSPADQIEPVTADTPASPTVSAPAREEQPLRRIVPTPKTRGSRQLHNESSSAASGSLVPGSEGNSAPGYLANPHPPYPPESKIDHEQGVVMLAVTIDPRGEVSEIHVKQSSGFSRLDRTAREGVLHWRFRPARVAGLPVAAQLVVPVRFRLSD